MTQVYPFRALRYSQQAAHGRDVGSLIAPPYDVLDSAGKAELLDRNSKNIVGVDLPHLPAKALGPPEAYVAAARTLQDWQAQGVLQREDKPVMYAYRQTFEFAGIRRERSGMACTVDVRAFGPATGGGILPHEETFSGPKEDRMALMKASAMQVSPIFGLHQDEGARASTIVHQSCAGQPTFHGQTPDGTRHEVWRITDERVLKQYADALKDEDIFIADGHHRYTTAINYLKERGTLNADHPARRCMFVLIGMSDPGLVIGPTHRILGGMKAYSWPAFQKEADTHFDIVPTGRALSEIEPAMEHRSTASGGRAVLGLHDFQSGACFTAVLRHPDPLAETFPAKVKAWRTLDVAIVQYLIVDRICRPLLNGGDPVQWAFPHSIAEVADIGSGLERGSGGGQAFKAQLGIIVRPTPLQAVREVSRANELMPQKSTFFYPKLATGLFLNPLS